MNTLYNEYSEKQFNNRRVWALRFCFRRLTARCVLRNKKYDCNLLNNRFLKKKSITMGNDVEMSKTL